MTMEEVFAPQIDPTNNDVLLIHMFIDGGYQKVAIDKTEKDIDLWRTLNECFIFVGYKDGSRIPSLQSKYPRMKYLLNTV